MTNTSDLIAELSNETQVSKPLRTPSYWGVRLLFVLILYGLATQYVLGLRPDVLAQLTRPFFALEISLLALLAITSIVASVLAMYPDAYQKAILMKLPYGIFMVLTGFMLWQLLLPVDARMVMPNANAHAFACALCIAMVSVIPSALIFMMLRKGASVHQFQAGAFAVLAASAIGGLTLRLAEPIDQIMHLTLWHYLPTLIFATIGALLGKWLLKW